jgi:RNA polymerase sigma factor (sigma-70 family)
MVATGERADVRALIAQWDRWIWRVSRRWARIAGLDHEDLHGEVVLRLLSESCGGYDPTRGTFPTWADNVARWVALRQRQYARRSESHQYPLRPERGRGEDDDFASTIPDDRAADPADVAHDRDLVRRVRGAVAGLTAEQREALVRRVVECGPARPGDPGVLDAALGELRDRLALIAHD